MMITHDHKMIRLTLAFICMYMYVGGYVHNHMSAHRSHRRQIPGAGVETVEPPDIMWGTDSRSSSGLNAKPSCHPQANYQIGIVPQSINHSPTPFSYTYLMS